MNSETKKLHYASYDKKKSGSKGNKKESFSSPKALVLLHKVLNLPVLENCVIDAGNHTLRDMKQSAKPKQPSAMVVEKLVITRTVARRQETSPRSHSMQRRCISQALQNKSSMMKKETELLLAVNTCYP